jgi:alpha-ketoglutarate-dependent taurine dioxygenase
MEVTSMDLYQEIEKNGYVRLDGLGLDDPNQILEQAIASFAKPIAYLGLPMVMDLKPQPGFQPASYAGTGEFDMHTDLTWFEQPPPYIGMFCVNMETAQGGIPLLSDGWQALADLVEADVAYLKSEVVTFPPPDHIDYPALTSPIITERQGKLMVRFRYDLLTDPAPPIRRYFEAINRHIIQVEVKPGSMFIFDNDRMLHGRTELKAGLNSDRHFKRIYGQQ